MTRLERIGGRVLSAGVAASSICLAVGLLLEVLGARSGGALLLDVGLVVLLATPAARLIVSVIEYSVERDWVFLSLVGIVLIELMVGVVAAFVFHRV